MSDVEYMGVRAEAQHWRAIGARLVTTPEGDRVTGWDWEDRSLLVAGAAALGLSGAQALAHVEAEVQRRREEKARVDGEHKLAQAIGELAKQLGEESAQALVARMPDRLRPYAEALLRRS